MAAGSGRTILKIHQPYSNHNGGNLAFGPGGYLYIGMGDGGSGGDPGNRAQDTDTLLGKMLRIDVNGTLGQQALPDPRVEPVCRPAGRNEIWLRGLRNPWRYSFDRATNRLWIGDVGQGRYEEVDRISTSPEGRQPGLAEDGGLRTATTRRSGCHKAGKVKPILAYSHAGRSLRDHRRLRVPRLGHPGARRAGTCSATTAAARSGRCRRRPGTHAEQDPAPQHAVLDQLVRRERDGELFVVDLGGHDLPDRPRLIPVAGLDGRA